MLSWEIKSNLLITFCKRTVFTKNKALNRSTVYFILDSFYKKSALESFHMKYIRIVRDHVRVYI